MPNLQILALDINQLSGKIPDFANLLNLEELWLDNNQLSGGIPTSLGNQSSLRKLRLNNNPLFGALPAELANLSSLSTFTFDSTHLCEPQDASFQSWLAGLPTMSSSNLSCIGLAGGDQAGEELVLSWSHLGEGVDHYEVYRSTCFSCPPDDPNFIKLEPDVPPPGAGDTVIFTDTTAFDVPINNYSYIIVAVAHDASHVGIYPAFIGAFNFDMVAGGP